MANRSLVVVAKVKDAASASLKKIQGSLKDTGGQAKQTAVNFSEFNRVMFATSAYLGLFSKSFSKFGEALFQGAQFDRVVNQFERILGPKGDLFSAISGFTDNSIDKVEALRSGIQLKTLGIAATTSEAAELIARAGTAGKMAGLDSAEGIKHFTQFLKDGSVANLEFLNLIRSADPALKLQMAMIGKMGGVMGEALNSTMKYNMGLRLLRMATEGSMKGQRDLYDVVFDLKQAFNLLKNEVGIFLGNAISGLMDKVTKAADKLSTLLEYIRTSKKEVLFLAKSFVVLGSALAGVLATFGTLRLVGIGFRALGFSATPLIVLVSSLVAVFSALTYNVKEVGTPLQNFIEKVRVFGAVIKGVYQLVSSYLDSQDNMRKGIGLLDKDLYELLNKNGLFLFVRNVSIGLAVMGRFGIEVFKQLVDWAKQLDDIFGKLGNRFSEIFGVNKKLNVDLEATGNVIDEPHVKRMSVTWLDANTKVGKILKNAAAALLVAFTASKFLGIGKGFLSKIPILGRLFKGSLAGKPDGTAANPIHVVMNGFGKILEGIFPKAATGAAAGTAIAGPSAMLSRVGTFFVSIFTPIKNVISGTIASFQGLSRIAGMVRGFAIIYSLLAALGLLVGTVKGVINNLDSFVNLFSSMYDALRSIDFGRIFNEFYNSVTESATELKNGISTYVNEKITGGKELLSNVVDSVSKFGSEAYNDLKKNFGDWAPILDPMKTKLDEVSTWFTKLIDNIKVLSELITNIPGYSTAKFAMEMVSKYTKAIINPLGAMMDAVAGNQTNVGKTALKGVTNPLETYMNFGQEGVGVLGTFSDMLADKYKDFSASNFASTFEKGGDLPFMPATSEKRGEYVNRAIDQAQGAEKDRLVRANIEALNDAVTPGQITPEEFARIFGIALDNSKIAKHTKATVDETKNGNQQKSAQSRRGGC